MRFLHKRDANAIENIYQLTDNINNMLWGLVVVKKYLFILMAALLLVGCGSKEDEAGKEESEKQKIDVDQTLETNNLELEIQTATVEDETIAIPIHWKQWNMYDEAHLSLVAHPVVEQDGEELETIAGEDDLLVKKKQLTPARASMKYKLISEDEPVTVRFLDIREEIRDEVITIELD